MRTWIALCLAAACGGLVARAQEPTDHDALVAQLAAPEFARREDAQAALVAAGKLAGPALLRARNHADLEVRTRARALIDALEIQSDADQALLDAALARLLDGPPGGREAAVRDALAHGAIGRQKLARALVAPQGSVKVTVVAPAWIDQVGAWHGRLVFTNTGARTVLLPLRHINYPSRRTRRPIGERSGSKCLTLGLGCAVGASEHLSRAPALEGARRLAPGASTEIVVDGPGRTLLGGAGVGAATLTWGITAKTKFVVDGMAHEIGVDDGLRARHTVEILPAPGATTSLRGATLSIRVGPDDRPGEIVAATLEIHNAGSAAVRIDADWPRYVWVALVSRDGASAVSRPASAFGAAVPASARRMPLELEPGARQSYSVAIPAPADPATYRLAAEYLNVELDEQCRPVAPDAENDSAGYAQGRMRAADGEVVTTVPGQLARLERDLVAVRDFAIEWQRLAVRIELMGKRSAPALIGALGRVDHADPRECIVAALVCNALQHVFGPTDIPLYDSAAAGEAGHRARAAVAATWRERYEQGALR